MDSDTDGVDDAQDITADNATLISKQSLPWASDVGRVSKSSDKSHATTASTTIPPSRRRGFKNDCTFAGFAKLLRLSKLKPKYYNN